MLQVKPKPVTHFHQTQTQCKINETVSIDRAHKVHQGTQLDKNNSPQSTKVTVQNTESIPDYLSRPDYTPTGVPEGPWRTTTVPIAKGARAHKIEPTVPEFPGCYRLVRRLFRQSGKTG